MNFLIIFICIIKHQKVLYGVESYGISFVPVCALKDLIKTPLYKKNYTIDLTI